MNYHRNQGFDGASATDADPFGPAPNWDAADGLPLSPPHSAKWDSKPWDGRWLATRQLQCAHGPVRYRIEGWIAERGVSVWFGAGSTGKTQLMLWMAATVATRPEDRLVETWLGGKVNGTGHVLVLTAEDTREEMIGRLRDVASRSMGQDEETLERTCSRLHVMPFLSMSREEFGHPNPSLMEPDRLRVWNASAVLDEIERYVRDWNLAHDADDRIIGVVMDSATSMAGFESNDAQATTTFFFHLGRLCELHDVFWAVIGHTPKEYTVPQRSWRATAASRLRGVAMWTTAPRLVVEVRPLQDWRNGRKIEPEAAELRAALGPDVRREDVLAVYVAKSNLLGASRDVRYLHRMRRGAFADVTERAGGEAAATASDERSGASADPPPPEAGLASSNGAKGASATSGKPERDDAHWASGTALVLEVVMKLYAAEPIGRLISARKVKRTVNEIGAIDPRTRLVLDWGGGRETARPGTIAWHLRQLEDDGKLEFGRSRYMLERFPALLNH